MKRIWIFAVTFTSLFANAEVIKPTSALKPANGVVVVDGAKFDYSVEDDGWRTSLSFQAQTINDKIVTSKQHAEANKTFELRYKSRPDESNLHESIVDALTTDAKDKCQELGGIEFSDQVKEFPVDKFIRVLNAEVRAPNASRPSAHSAEGSFLCFVTITIVSL